MMWWRRRAERDLEDELAFHRAQLQPRPELFGAEDRVAEECRDVRRGAWWDGVMRDVRHGWRSLRRERGWTAVMVLTLALGIGATSAAFGLVYAALLRPLPFPQSGSLVWVSASNQQLGLEEKTLATPSELQAWAPELGRLFSDYAWLRGGGPGGIWNVNGQAVMPWTRKVSVNLFPMLGVKPVLGRLFAPGEDRDGAASVAVVSYRFWQTAFGGNRDVIGKVIQEQFGPPEGIRIVGVLPAWFALEQPTEVWTPASPIHSTQEFRAYFLLARRRPGVTLSAVQAAMAGLEKRNPPPHDMGVQGNDWRSQAVPLATWMSEGLGLPMLLLLGAVACLLLLACANAANLLYARNRQRQPELAIRLALGCSRGRLVRQLLIEGGLLAAGGAVVGVAGAAVGLRVLLSPASTLLPAAVARVLAGLRVTVLSPATLGFAAGLTVVTLVGFGLGPALQAAGWNLRHRMEPAARNRATQRLVVIEAALATVLVVGAGLLGRSFVALASVNPGFEARGRISVQVDMPRALTPCGQPNCARLFYAQATAYLDQVLARLRALPGVTGAAAVGGLPLGDDDAGSSPGMGPQNIAQVFPSMVTPGYFEAMGARMLAGRDFNASDVPGATKAVIVNQAFVRRFYGGVIPVGRQVAIARCHFDNPHPEQGCTIVGVVADVHEDSLALAPEPAAYVDFNQDATANLVFVLRTERPEKAVMADMERMLPQMPLFAGHRPYVFPPRTLEATVGASIATPRFRAWLSALLAALALALAGVGVLGVQAYAVTRRTAEIGTRMALGARRGDIVRLVMGETLGWTLAGALAGLSLGVIASRLLASMLFQVRAWDAVTLLGAPLVLLLTAAMAAWVPARRAAGVDPARALRTE